MINCDSFFFDENEHLYGKGKRLVLFCQGCSLRCHGCSNAHLWEFGKGTDISVEQLCSLVNRQDVEGITLLGGEPLDQCADIAELIARIKQMGKTVVLFTGYHRKELIEPAQRRAWALADIVISGRYVEAKRSLYLQFRGSTNQRVYRHKGRYRNYTLSDGQTSAVFEVDESGNLTARGFIGNGLNQAIKDVTTKC